MFIECIMAAVTSIGRYKYCTILTYYSNFRTNEVYPDPISVRFSVLDQETNTDMDSEYPYGLDQIFGPDLQTSTIYESQTPVQSDFPASTTSESHIPAIPEISTTALSEAQTRGQSAAGPSTAIDPESTELPAYVVPQNLHLHPVSPAIQTAISNAARIESHLERNRQRLLNSNAQLQQDVADQEGRARQFQRQYTQMRAQLEEMRRGIREVHDLVEELLDLPGGVGSEIQGRLFRILDSILQIR